MSHTIRGTADPARQEEFAGRMVEVLNDACLGYLCSLGHRTRLFDVMAGLPPSTSEEIADAAGLNERYVREWLGGVTVGGIVGYDPADGTYRLPPEHAASLCRAAGPDNLASFLQDLALIGLVEDEVVTAFRDGGGVPYSSYPKFQELQAEETARVYDAALVDVIIPLAPGLPELLGSGGGLDVLDVGTGQGHAVNLLARAFPASRFTGVDMSEGGIAAARAEAARLGLRNAHFDLADAAAVTGPYDLITAFDVIHDLARPAETLAAVAGALRDDGVFLMGDIAASSRLEENLDLPLGPTLYAFSVFYCMTTSLSEGGAGLGTVWGRQTALRMLKEAGFGEVAVREVEGDILNVYYVARKGS
ncbi:class I SAM-dependent methyltransferase [Streptomyces fimicarius]|uniref:Class I SAM-dependent methyltransferase n=1 Tax=Streptomyces caviscabies TaxID=90079 RepID=A0ABW2MA67_9ACTN|nr:MULTISPECIES: methyltransferase domain-containing protein [unclassified Streptomyces]MDX3338770.1 methyltransferase domain-containing protein [Streptomyces sp. ME02-6979.5a]MDX3504342.1 methyltransferase domain-containing protein [Streptomyces sp. ATCC51928]MDX3595113.1 methyltransferase domain-containing protein [Streptomyces sp. ID03-2B]MDX5519494.1 methyltransferase domain-containing protein [Streptomyces sp. DE06-01C]